MSLVLVFRHLHEGDKLARLAESAAKGVLSLRVADALPAARAAEAHRRFEAHGVRGRRRWPSDEGASLFSGRWRPLPLPVHAE